MQTLEVIKRYIAKTMEWIGVVLVALLTVLSIIAVILRYFFEIVFIQTEELITFLFIATVFLGSVVVMYHKEHVSVTLFQMYMPRPIQKLMRVFQYIVMIAVNILLLYASAKWIMTNMNFLTPGLRIPYWCIYAVVPISCTLTSVVAIIDLIEMTIFPGSAHLDEEADK